MKLIFLDFDGVLVSGHYYYFGEFPNRAAVLALNRLIRETDAKIVVSSSWRVGTPLDELQETLEVWGVKGEVVGKTPILKGYNDPRGVEIQAFMDDFSINNEIDSFVIVDDNSDMVHLISYLVQTDMREGLTNNDVDKCIKILNNIKANGMAQ